MKFRHAKFQSNGAIENRAIKQLDDRHCGLFSIFDFQLLENGAIENGAKIQQAEFSGL
jgi:hypothetical protein